MNWKLLVCSALISTSTLASVKSYFNHNLHTNYKDPYRNRTRLGDNLEQVIVNEILTAKKSVYVAVQELRLPLIAQALIKRHKEGLDVRVVIEHDYNFSVINQRDANEMSEYEASKLADLRAFVDANQNKRIEKEELETRDAIYMLQMAQVPMLDDTADSSLGSGLMHHKFVVVDGKSVIVSTANFTMSCIHGDLLVPESRGNANSLVHIESSKLGEIFTQEFTQLWGNGRRGNFGQNKTYRGPQTVTVKGVSITVQFSPTSRRLTWNESVNGLIGQQIKNARESVKGALFVFSDQQISNLLEKAHERGTQMGFVIEPKFAYREYSELLDMMGLQMLGPNCKFEADNKPWKRPATDVGIAGLPRGDVLHHKFAVIDGKSVVVGSQNWSDAANYTNDETLLVINSSEISDGYTREFERIMKTSSLGPTPKLEADINNREIDCSDWHL